METNHKMDYYQPLATRNFNQTHTLLYTFQFEEGVAKMVTSVSGNISGGATMNVNFDTGITVPADHEITKKYVTFYDETDADKPFREVGDIIFHYPNGETLSMDLGDASDFLIGIQIINFDTKEAE